MRGFFQGLGPITGPTPCVRASRSCPCGAPCGPGGDGHGPTQRLPRPAPDVAVPARGLRPRQGRVRLARGGLPRVRSAAAPRWALAGLPTLPARSPVTAAAPVPEARAGRGASVVGSTFPVGDLHSFTSCRFVSAHPNAGHEPRALARRLQALVRRRATPAEPLRGLLSQFLLQPEVD